MKQDNFRGQSKNKKWGKTAVFFHNLHSSEVIFIITIVTRLNEYAEIINLFTRIFEWDLGFGIVRIK